MEEVMKMQGDEMMKMMQMATMNISQMSQQMGVVTSQLNAINNRMSIMENRMQGYEDKIRITRDQQRRIKGGIHGRVNFLLDLQTSGGVVRTECLDIDKKYRGGFIRRCYHDARTHSRLGEPYSETLQRDFEECMNYINNWIPEVNFDGVSGVEAYKRYLDVRNEENRSH